MRKIASGGVRRAEEWSALEPNLSFRFEPDSGRLIALFRLECHPDGVGAADACEIAFTPERERLEEFAVRLRSMVHGR
jgi:hypothetical protein